MSLFSEHFIEDKLVNPDLIPESSGLGGTRSSWNFRRGYQGVRPIWFPD